MTYKEFMHALETMYESQKFDMENILKSEKRTDAVRELADVIVRFKFKKTDEYKYLWNIPGFEWTDARMFPMVDVNIRTDSTPITENAGPDGIVVFKYERYDLVDDANRNAKIILPRHTEFMNYAMAFSTVRSIYDMLVLDAVEKAKLRAKWFR